MSRISRVTALIYSIFLLMLLIIVLTDKSGCSYRTSAALVASFTPSTVNIPVLLNSSMGGTLDSVFEPGLLSWNARAYGKAEKASGAMSKEDVVRIVPGYLFPISSGL